MERSRVSSTSLHSVGYDPVTATLEIQFLEGAIYQYANVPSGVHTALMNAPSKGQYLDRHIKDHYRYRKVAG